MILASHTVFPLKTGILVTSVSPAPGSGTENTPVTCGKKEQSQHVEAKSVDVHLDCLGSHPTSVVYQMFEINASVFKTTSKMGFKKFLSH